MGCCGPSTCFTFKDQPSSSDACMCGCGYFNGMCAIWMAQFFTLLGFLLSVAAMTDCSFVTINPTTAYIFDFLGGIIRVEARGVGFLFFERPNGYCYYYTEDLWNNYAENPLQLYWDILGNLWMAAAALAFASAASALLIFLYSISFCCSSQARCCRYFNGLLLMAVLTTCQACSFVVYSSDFCNTYGCSFSRGSGLAVGAIASYILAGIGFFLSTDYPGDEFVSPMQSNPVSEVEDPEFATSLGSNTGFYPNDYSTTTEEQAIPVAAKAEPVE